MAKLVRKITLGIDVAKDECVVYDWHTAEIVNLPNQPTAIKTWLQSLHGPVQIALEPTSHYHLVLVEAALARGHTVYLVNPRQLAHYREAVNVRNKTDPQDAWLLARYLAHEGTELRPYQPQCRQAQQLWTLLKRRAVVVQARQQLQQSFSDIKLSARALFSHFRHLLERIDLRIGKLIRALGWSAHYQRCVSMPGIGLLNGAALVAAYHRGAFANSDAFVAFLGLDIRVRESGKYRGKCKLTKRGEAELRRLLYCAAQGARSYRPFEVYYQRQLAKGLSKTAAKIVLARKLVRIAFTLMQNQTMFVKQPESAG